MDTEYYKFDLSFDGNLVEHSADAFDVANTIMAISATLQQMVKIKYGDEAAKQVFLNINAFKEGSLKTQFLMFLTEPEKANRTVELIEGMGLSVFQVAKQSLEMLNTYIDVRKKLKGGKPKSIKSNPGGNTYNITLNDNSSLTINQSDLKALQDKTIARNVDKVIEPLQKEGSQLESLSIIPSDSVDTPISVNKVEADYVRHGNEELQIIPEMRLKGVVTKIDTKVRSGYLNLGNMTSRRISFVYSKSTNKTEFDTLINSLQSQVQIYLMGNVESDLEGQPISINIVSIEQDEKLL